MIATVATVEGSAKDARGTLGALNVFCEKCGRALAYGGRGRPPKFCAECFKKRRREYEHSRYLQRKYGEELSETELKIKELEDRKRLDENKIARHNKWHQHYLKQRPYLWMLKSALTFEEKERILRPYRRKLMRELDSYGARSGELYHEVLWQPKKKKKKRN